MLKISARQWTAQIVVLASGGFSLEFPPPWILLVPRGPRPSAPPYFQTPNYDTAGKPQGTWFAANADQSVTVQLVSDPGRPPHCHTCLGWLQCLLSVRATERRRSECVVNMYVFNYVERNPAISACRQTVIENRAYNAMWSRQNG